MKVREVTIAYRKEKHSISLITFVFMDKKNRKHSGFYKSF